MIDLPEVYLERMKRMLGDEYDSYVASLSDEPKKGIRLNTLKCSEDMLKSHMKLTPSPFSVLSFYVSNDLRPGKDPFHIAGAYYVQEPSASSAVTVLDPQPGEKVLDMCAAPGGKSTQIAALLNGKGLLWSNEVVKSRANILLSNIERMGIRNCVVSSCFPEKLSERLEGFFDKILVDAPCSGEGMFRKDEAAVKEWTPEHVTSCAKRQRSILSSAAKCLKPGGALVYSTCTFSREENEETILDFLEEHKDFSLSSPNVSFGRKAFDIDAVRIFPMDGGEGHFVAKLVKNSNSLVSGKAIEYIRNSGNKTENEMIKVFLEENFPSLKKKAFDIIAGNILLLPDLLPDLRGCGVIRAGVLLGNIKGKRIEPAHAAFMCMKPYECKNSIDLSPGSPELAAFYRGEEINCETNGYTAVSTCGMVSGFGKASGGRLKNKFPKGLRLH